MEKHKILINTYKYEEINMDNVEKILSNTSILLNSFNSLNIKSNFVNKIKLMDTKEFFNKLINKNL